MRTALTCCLSVDPIFISRVKPVPVAVPDKIFGLALLLDFIDRCHSLTSLHPPQAAFDSLPTGHFFTLLRKAALFKSHSPNKKRTS